MRSQQQYKTVSGYKKMEKIASQYLCTILFWTFSIRDIRDIKTRYKLLPESSGMLDVGILEYTSSKHVTRRGLIV